MLHTLIPPKLLNNISMIHDISASSGIENLLFVPEPENSCACRLRLSVPEWVDCIEPQHVHFDKRFGILFLLCLSTSMRKRVDIHIFPKRYPLWEHGLWFFAGLSQISHALGICRCRCLFLDFFNIDFDTWLSPCKLGLE
ncbi:hypothetical protein VNO77_11455 [Canavalia gladiata]|uniref:Uncharacterized protein n=1 Tax=Canavalia gladiata TaxID=3824 RepID=A0AAN9R2N4_CANGL